METRNPRREGVRTQPDPTQDSVLKAILGISAFTATAVGAATPEGGQDGEKEADDNHGGEP